MEEGEDLSAGVRIDLGNGKVFDVESIDRCTAGPNRHYHARIVEAQRESVEGLAGIES